MTTLIRTCATATLLLGLSAPAIAQQSGSAAPSSYPAVTFGTQSFLQYAAELVDEQHQNAFDVTRGYLNIQARLSPRVRFRFTPDVRPTTDASLTTNLTLRLEYAQLEADVSDRGSVLFGMHETPWLAFEQSINRYRVQGTMFAERQGLIPGQTDLGASFRRRGERAEVHVGVYNGEGYGRAELDRYKSVQGRVSYTVLADDIAGSNVRLSGFYSHGWYARDRPRNLAIIMGSYEHPNVVATAQYVMSKDNPFVAQDIDRRGTSLFGEVRQGPTGWAGLARVDFYDPDRSNASDSTHRYIFGGAHWSQLGQGRFGVVISLDQRFRSANADRLETRLLAQTHVEF
jgi:hypothetical protein